jgi:hypothetical protein
MFAAVPVSPIRLGRRSRPRLHSISHSSARYLLHKMPTGSQHTDNTARSSRAESYSCPNAQHISHRMILLYKIGGWGRQPPPPERKSAFEAKSPVRGAWPVSRLRGASAVRTSLARAASAARTRRASLVGRSKAERNGALYSPVCRRYTDDLLEAAGGPWAYWTAVSRRIS